MSFDIVKYWRERAQKEGLKLFGPEHEVNQDAIVCALGNDRGWAGLAVTGLEMMQIRPELYETMAESRFKNAMTTLKTHTKS